MNDIFSFNRYLKLVKKELTERAPVVIKIAAIFSIILFSYWLGKVFGIFNHVNPIGTGSRITYILFATFVTMIIAPFNLYKNYNHPKKGIDFIVLPASVTEKFFSMQIISVVILPLATFFLLLLVDSLLATISPSIFSGYAVNDLWSHKNLLENISETLIFQQGCIFGNFLFRKNKIFKTIMAGISIYLVLAIIIVFIISVLFKEQFAELQGMNRSFTINNASELNNFFGEGNVPGFFKWLQNLTIILFYVIFPLGFISGTFYKMKTQQY